MSRIQKTIVIVTIVTILLCIAMASSADKDDAGLADYSSEEVAAAIKDILMEVPEKRRMCRPGMTYQPITRQCLPSLGSLKGRGRGRHRG